MSFSNNQQFSVLYIISVPHIQFNGGLGLYDVVVDNYTVMHCSQTHFYPPSVDAPKTENPANTIACKNLVILDQKIKKTQVFFFLGGGWIRQSCSIFQTCIYLVEIYVMISFYWRNDNTGISFPVRNLCKSRETANYNCNGGWSYSSEWKAKHPESFMCRSPWVSSGTLYTCWYRILLYYTNFLMHVYGLQ